MSWVLAWVLAGTAVVWAIEPHWVKTSKFTSLNDADPIVAVEYLNSLGLVMQQQRVFRTSGSRTATVGGMYYDGAMRDSIQTKPLTASTNGAFLPMDGFALIARSKTYWQGMGMTEVGDYPYSEVRYWPDGRVKEAAKSGTEFSLRESSNPAENGHHVKTWYTLSADGMQSLLWPYEQVFDADGFILTGLLTGEDVESKLDALLGMKAVVHGVSWQASGEPECESDGECEFAYLVTTDEGGRRRREVLTSGDRVILRRSGTNDELFEFAEDTWTKVDSIMDGALVWVQSFDWTTGENSSCIWQWVSDPRVWGSFFVRGPSLMTYQYHLRVTRNEEGAFTQELVDRDGRTAKTWANPDLAAAQESKLVSCAKVRLGGSVIREVPPQGSGQPTGGDALSCLNIADTRGQGAQRTTPDAGTVRFRYDNSGLLRFEKNAIHTARDEADAGRDHYLLCDYDYLGRKTALCEHVGSHDFDDPEGAASIAAADRSPKIRRFYDTLTVSDLRLILGGRSETLADALTRELFGTPLTSGASTEEKYGKLLREESSDGMLLAEMAINRNGRKVTDIYRYDPRGRVIASYKFVPGVPPQKREFTYQDFTGEVETERYYRSFEESWVMHSVKHFTYDSDRRLASLAMGSVSTPKVKYAYSYDFGMKEKLFIKDDGSGEVLDGVYYDYHHQGQTKEIRTGGTDPIFREVLHYENGGSGIAGRYDGGISGLEFSGRNEPGAALQYPYSVGYTYDGTGRLTAATEVTGPGLFDASFSFDHLSRFTSKREGSSILEGYEYPDNSSRLRYIGASDTKGQQCEGSDCADNYLYDPKGNMVLDRSKNMVVVYDWRNMPVLFKFYSPRVPVDDLSGAGLAWNTLHELDNRTDCSNVSQVEMVYDAGGNRVQKMELHTKDAP